MVEDFRNARGQLLYKMKIKTDQNWKEFSWKIPEPVQGNITLPTFVLPFSFQLKTYAFQL